MQDLMPVRVFFSKTGRAKYIAHLDTMRTLTRAAARSGLPFWYTQGFNPHLYLTFALPLALGTEGLCESMDARLTEPVDFEQVAARLGESMPPGFAVLRTAPPRQKPEAIAWADYEIALLGWPGGLPPAGALRAFFELERIEVSKKTKKGERQLDLKPHVRLLGCETPGDSLQIRVRLAAGNTLNIAPKLLLDALFRYAGAQPERSRIRRVRILDGENRDFQ